MVKVYGTLVLLTLQGCCCKIFQVTQELGTGNNSIKYIEVGKFDTCIRDLQNVTWFQCIPKLMDMDLLFDYDFNNKYLYHFVNLNLHYRRTMAIESERKINCQTKDSNSSCGIPLIMFERTGYIDVVDITLDWVHHNLYIICYEGDSLFEDPLDNSELYREEGTYEPEPPIEPKNIAEPAGIIGDQLKFVDLQVDPYNKFLFIQVSSRTKPNVDFSATNFTAVIIRSNLLVKEPRLTPNKIFSKNMKFYISVSEKRIYVLDKKEIYIYDYDGREMQQPLKNYPFSTELTVEFTVFRNIAYSFFTYNERNYIGYVSLQVLSAQSGHAFTRKLRNGKKRFMIYDVRTKRQMINGNYVCDRKDCPDLCKVLPTEEVCVCRESRAMTRDGLTCYDCGQSNLTSVTTQPMIVGGQTASLRNFPWHSVIYQLIEGSWKQTCGGTLISSNRVLTAAHCVVNLENTREQEKIDKDHMTVVLGKINRDWNAYETTTEVWTKVKEILPHSDFMGNLLNYANDIALLTLDSKVNFTRFVMPACIDFNHNQLPSYNTLKAYFPGFGFTADCVTSSMCSEQSTDLMYATSKVINFTECIRSALNKSSDSFLTLSQDKFCIGDGSESPVQKGDSGGGLTLAYQGLHYVTGVVSVKFMKYDGDSFDYSYGAFTNLSHHMDWLKRNMAEGQ